MLKISLLSIQETNIRKNKKYVKKKNNYQEHHFKSIMITQTFLYEDKPLKMYRHILRGPNKLNTFLRDNSSIRHSQCEASFFEEMTSRLSGVLISWEL